MRIFKGEETRDTVPNVKLQNEYMVLFAFAGLVLGEISKQNDILLK